jgi:hypothetical protein
MFEGILFFLAALGVRQRNRVAAIAAFSAYLLSAFVLQKHAGNGFGILRVIFLALLLANIRGSWVSARWKTESAGGSSADTIEPDVRRQAVGSASCPSMAEVAIHLLFACNSGEFPAGSCTTRTCRVNLCRSCTDALVDRRIYLSVGQNGRWWVQLKSDIAKNLVPMLYIWFFASKRASQKRYRDLCQHLNGKVWTQFSRAKEQFSPGLTELQEVGYLSQWDLCRTIDDTDLS